ncbi:DUF6350 family protein [Bifidobacterium sp. SO4]|uniref:cell division protein PerM n=1 Tax=Bifidobacterium sp. SO4 TaxID=2809030 RepID=UPI001BDD575C|nr:DUF6350 family protein [Bifidobacterium sp. SO4]MBT1170201.1 hypothetical protein [Bifidobacterium sp. SO4]
MKAVIRQWVRGALAALASMAIYAIALGCYVALMLLVISMEEGGENLTTGTTGLTKAVVLLSEGSGFATDSVTLTITPLLLTILLIWLIATLVARLKATGPHALVTGLLVWLALNEWFRQSVHLSLVDDQWITLLKAGTVFLLGFLCAAVPGSDKLKDLMVWIRKQSSAKVRHCLKTGVAVAAIILGLYLLIGLITVIVWTVRNHTAVVSVFEMSGMETGSRILTTLAMIIWLPNLMLWAVSWLFGSGFAIGDVASFTLWVGQSKDLPAVPAFGILPEAVSSELWRTIALNTPFAVATLVGLLALFLPAGFRYRPISVRSDSDRRAMVLDLAYPAGAFCLSAGLVSLGSTVLFALSNGSLGQHRLAHVGVSVMASTRAVGHPTALGLATAWLVALIGTALVFSVGWIAERLHPSRTSGAAPANGSAGDGDTAAKPGADGQRKRAKRDGAPRKPRQSVYVQSQPKPSKSQSTTKEEQDDKHEPADTSSTGFRLS